MAFVLAASVGLAVLPASGPAEATGSKDLFPSAAGDTACGTAGATQTASALTNHDNSVSYSNPNGPNQSCRYLLEWRSGRYGPTSKTTIPRRSLFWVYAKAGEYILMGSSEIQQNMSGGSNADIQLWDPERAESVDGPTTHIDIPNPKLTATNPGEGGTSHPNLDEITNEQLNDTVDWKCSTGGTTEGGVAYTDYDAPGSGGVNDPSAIRGSRNGANNGANDGTGVNWNTRGILNSRAKENAGAVATGNAAGYTPCSFRAPHDGAYAVGFIGYAGPLDNTDGAPPGSGTETSATPNTNYFIPNASTFTPIGSGPVTRAWDLTVRTDPASTATNQVGRVFTYALAGWVGQPYYPLDVTYWLTTQDGFRYRVKTNGITPVGFVLFGNDEGFLNDDGSPLHHDVFASAGLDITPSAMLQSLTGDTDLDEPLYPMSFDSANGGALANDTLDYLNIPQQPQAPVLTGLTYTGAIGSNETYGGLGGTFYADTLGRGTIMIVVASRTHDANDDGDCTDAGDAITESDPDYWDPTNPCNSTTYSDVDSAVTDLPIPWYGNDNKGDAFVIGEDFPVLATLRGGEYHMPMFDLEGSVWGSPTFTVVNPPDVTEDGIGDCPTFYAADYDYGTDTGSKVTGCSQAFFDDRGYRTTLGGVDVGTIGDFVCPPANQLGLEPDAQSNARAQDGSLAAPYSETRYASDPLLGFDSDAERRVRAFGAAGPNSDGAGEDWVVNANSSCASPTGSPTNRTLGDAAGLELWTFYPSVTRKTGDPNFPAPDLTVKAEPLTAVDDGTFQLTLLAAQQSGTTPVDVSGCGTTPASGMATNCLLHNDAYAGNGDDVHHPLLPGQVSVTLECLVATDAAASAFGTSGPIFDQLGNSVGTITVTGTPNGSDPCAYNYSFDDDLANGSYHATYRLRDTTSLASDTALITFAIGGIAIDDLASTRTAGTIVHGNVTTNDLCTPENPATPISWVNTYGSSATPTAWSYSPWLSSPVASPNLSPDLSAIGTVLPGDDATDHDNLTTTTAASNASLLGVDGSWYYTPSATYSGVLTRQYRINVAGGMYVADTANNKIRAVTTGGVVTTIAGPPAGSNTAGDEVSTIQWNGPQAAVIDSTGVTYIADTANNKIKKIALDGTVTIIAGPSEGVTTAGDVVAGTVSSAWRFNGPAGLAISASNQYLYIADTGNNKVKRLDLISNTLTIYVGAAAGTTGTGDAVGITTNLNAPRGLALSATTLYIADSGNNKIVQVLLSGPTKSVFSGPNFGTTTANNTESTTNKANVRFSNPRGLALGASGTYLYVADTTNSRIRRLNVTTGTVGASAAAAAFAGAAAGNADGTGTAATFNTPQDIAYDGQGDLYVADTGNNKIRVIAETSAVTTTAFGPATGTTTAGDVVAGDVTAWRYSAPAGIASNGAGKLVIADTANNKIKKITLAESILAGPAAGTTTALDTAATGLAARFNLPSGAVVDSTGTYAYFAVSYVAGVSSSSIRRLTLATGAVTTIAGSTTAGTLLTDGDVFAGAATAWRFSFSTTIATGLALSPDNLSLYVADTGNNKIKRITLNGSGNATAISVFVGDTDAGEITAPSDANETAQGTALTANTVQANVTAPSALAISPDGSTLYFTTTGTSGAAVANKIWRVNNLTGSPTKEVFAGAALGQSPALGDSDATADNGATAAGNYTQNGNATSYTRWRFLQPQGLAVGGTGIGDYLYVADTGNNKLKRIAIVASGKPTQHILLAGPAAGTITAGDVVAGATTAWRFNAPRGLAVSGTSLYLADSGVSKIKLITLSGSVAVPTANAVYAGPPAGTTAAADVVAGGTYASRYNGPWAIALTPSGALLVADRSNNKIKQILSTPTAEIILSGPSVGVTSAGDVLLDLGLSTAARFNGPTGLVMDSGGNLFVADTANNKIKKIDPDGKVTIFAGPPVGDLTAGTTDGTGTAARFSQPTGLAIDTSGNLYVTDTSNSRIRKITPAGVVTTLAGPTGATGTNGWTDSATPASVRFNGPRGIAIDATDTYLYVADTANSRIRRVVVASGVTTTFAGRNNGTLTTGDRDGTGAGNTGTAYPLFNLPQGITIDNDGNLWVADTANNKVRRIVIGAGATAGAVTTPWGPAAGSTTATPNGQNGTANNVRFDTPGDITVDPTTGALYVVDSANDTVRYLPLGGTSTTFVGTLDTTAPTAQDGTGGTARFDSPGGIVWNANGGCDNPRANVRITVVPVAQPDNELPKAANTVQTCSVTWADHSGDLDWMPAHHDTTGSTDYAPVGECNPLANDRGRDATGSQIDIALGDYSLVFPGGEIAFTNNCTPAAYPTLTVGCFAMASNGTWTFTPPTTWTGAVDVNYGATGAGGDSFRSTMTLHVAPVPANDTGQANAWNAFHPQTVPNGNVSVTGNILTNDQGLVDVGSCTPAAAHGTLTMNAGGIPGAYEYEADEDWSGQEVFTCQALTVSGAAVSETLTVKIMPVGVDDEATTDPVTLVTGNVLPNDAGDIPSLAGSAAVMVEPGQETHGAFVLNVNGSWTYTPEAGFSGDVVIDYDAQDSSGESYSATLTIHVTRFMAILKRGETGESTWIPMDGSEWEIYTDAALTMLVTDPAIESLDDPGEPAETDPGTGLFRVEELPDGDYYLVESRALSGFALLAQPIKFHVSADGEITILAGASENIEVGVVDGIWQITVDDVPAFVLPNAGGPGTLAFTEAGTGLLVLALGLGLGFFLYLRRKPTGRHAKPRA